MRTRGFVALVVAGVAARRLRRSGPARAPRNRRRRRSRRPRRTRPQQLAADKAIATQGGADAAPTSRSDTPSTRTTIPATTISACGRARSSSTCAHLPEAAPRRLERAISRTRTRPTSRRDAIGAGPAIDVESNVELDRVGRTTSASRSPTSPRRSTVNCFAAVLRSGVRRRRSKGEPGVTLSDFTVRALSTSERSAIRQPAFQGRVTIGRRRVRRLPLEFNLYFVRAGRGNRDARRPRHLGRRSIRRSRRRCSRRWSAG